VSRERENHNKQLIRQAFEDWAAGTGGPFALLAEDATWTIVGNTPASRTYHSRDEFIGQVIGPFNARLTTPLIPTVHALYADGDTVIAYFSASATAKDGQPYQNTYTWYLDLDGDRITSAIAFFDSIEFTDFWNRITPA
jgi:uncharacterized protein